MNTRPASLIAPSFLILINFGWVRVSNALPRRRRFSIWEGVSRPRACPLSTFVVLNWSRNAEDSFTLNPVDLSNRDDLLAAIMKPPGPFFLPQEGDAPRTVFDLDKNEYVRRLQAVAVFEATGRANFDTVCETILKQVR